MRLFGEIPRRKVLILSPHTDDGELGAGGTIRKLVDNKHIIQYTVFSSPTRANLKEFQEATKVLGVPRTALNCMDLSNKRLPHYRQEILERLVRVRDGFRPDIVLCPSLQDIHQDHQTVAQEAQRVFKGTTVLGWEEPWNNPQFRPDCFVILTSGQITKKILALRQYYTQFDKPYMATGFIRGLARARGVQIGRRYAEAFEVIRWVID